MARVSWKGRREEIAELLAGGASGKDIAKLMGVSVITAYGGLRRLGLFVDEEGAKQRRADSIRAIVKDPVYMARRVAAAKRAAKRPEVRAKRSAASRASWQDPDRRARNIEGLRAAMARMTSEQLSARTKLGHERKRERAKAAARYEQMTPFERLCEDVRLGRKSLTTRVVQHRAGPDYTLGGVSAGML